MSSYASSDDSDTPIPATPRSKKRCVRFAPKKLGGNDTPDTYGKRKADLIGSSPIHDNMITILEQPLPEKPDTLCIYLIRGGKGRFKISDTLLKLFKEDAKVFVGRKYAYFPDYHVHTIQAVLLKNNISFHVFPFVDKIEFVLANGQQQYFFLYDENKLHITRKFKARFNPMTQYWTVPDENKESFVQCLEKSGHKLEQCKVVVKETNGNFFVKFQFSNNIYRFIEESGAEHIMTQGTTDTWRFSQKDYEQFLNKLNDFDILVEKQRKK